MPYQGVFLLRTHQSPLRQQFWDTDKVVADQIEQKVGGDSGETPVFRLAHGAVLRSGPGNLNKPLDGESATVDALTGR